MKGAKTMIHDELWSITLHHKEGKLTQFGFVHICLLELGIVHDVSVGGHDKNMKKMHNANCNCL